MDPLLCNTIPVYLGCRNIKKYLNDNIIILSGDIQKDIPLLIDIIKNPDNYKFNIKLDEIKDKINIIKHLDELFC
jgi:hypothetical protein